MVKDNSEPKSSMTNPGKTTKPYLKVSIQKSLKHPIYIDLLKEEVKRDIIGNWEYYPTKYFTCFECRWNPCFNSQIWCDSCIKKQLKETPVLKKESYR